MEKTNVSRKFFFFSKINKRNCWILSKTKWRNGKALPKLVRQKHNSKEETDVIATANDNWGIIIRWQFHKFFSVNGVLLTKQLSCPIICCYYILHMSGFLPRFFRILEKSTETERVVLSTFSVGTVTFPALTIKLTFLLYFFFAKQCFWNFCWNWKFSSNIIHYTSGLIRTNGL